MTHIATKAPTAAHESMSCLQPWVLTLEICFMSNEIATATLDCCKLCAMSLPMVDIRLLDTTHKIIHMRRPVFFCRFNLRRRNSITHPSQHGQHTRIVSPDRPVGISVQYRLLPHVGHFGANPPEEPLGAVMQKNSDANGHRCW